MKYYTYKFDGYTFGIVKAKTPEEAKRKVKEAYTKHGGYESEITKNMIEIEDTENNWFSDCPDVVEFGGY